VKSREEAVEWAKRCPAVKVESGAVIEVRQVFEWSEWTDDVRKAANAPAIEHAINKKK